MATTYEAIATVEVGSGGAANITFSSIPQTYTDLVLKLSSRTDRADIDDVLQIQPNGSSANLTIRNIRGDGSSVASGNNTTWSGGYIIGNTATSSTFGNLEAYFTNYAGSTNKSWSIDTATENNATASYSGLFAVLWSQTTAISSLVLIPLFGTLFLQHSTATLYGIKNS